MFPPRKWSDVQLTSLWRWHNSKDMTLHLMDHDTNESTTETQHVRHQKCHGRTHLQETVPPTPENIIEVRERHKLQTIPMYRYWIQMLQTINSILTGSLEVSIGIIHMVGAMSRKHTSTFWFIRDNQHLKPKCLVDLVQSLQNPTHQMYLYSDHVGCKNWAYFVDLLAFLQVSHNGNNYLNEPSTYKKKDF